MNVFIDSNILIDYFKGNEKAPVFLNNTFRDHSNILCIGAIQRAEIVFFARPNEEAAIDEVLSNLKCIEINQEVIDLGAKLFKKWNPSRGIDINDAILAATVELNGGIIYTLNTKHFPMENISIKKAY